MTTISEEKLKETVTPFLKEAGVIRSSLFGSYARGEANEASDVDILIEAPDGMTLFGLGRLKRLLENALGREVDILTYGGIDPKLEKYILKDLVPIF
ncbi:MAG: hypothetical protein A3I39_01690 [Candidatus Yanofskybacteria bacterium RIFCSPLOWO2_02_FULL_47_9b]|uniref:Polymerase nucleotidyl transferase domain-containing protein n=1 Tax=Candidatus Yanofskybacteria bacterium RIFCSPLOWO2_02_FULL_47_9b TaxID=1802708 RepID=A0A1F8H8X6_9BACT|nr:MAG: hypothetical protein A3I39_01690 [Candidatus Yanofskybacteria bacterium RIFCSPLOWO2_02_FULL_47_9b]